MKWKHKTTFIEFLNRFYSPSMFIVMTCSAFDLIDYTYAGPLIILLALLSSVVVSYWAWERWKKDFWYLAETNYKIPWSVTIFIVLCESTLQFLVSIASFWWISRVPHCVFKWYGIERHTQAYMWVLLLILVMFACNRGLPFGRWRARRQRRRRPRDTYCTSYWVVGTDITAL